MRILVLSDIHIAASTPWGADYEDMRYLRKLLKEYKSSGKLPEFDMCLLCGDIFNSPRLSQGDYPVFAEILEILGVIDKPIGAINGNHDTGGHHVCENLKGFHRLDVEPMMGIVGHSYSQNIDEVRDWLKRTNAPVTVTHQSCSLFMNLGVLLVPQLRGEDFHSPLNLVGDTHISHAVEVKEKAMCVSPGILCPMRSRAELFDCDPQLVYLDMDYLGSGRWDVDNADLSFVQLPRRSAVLVDEKTSEMDIRTLDMQIKDGDFPVIAYVPKGLDTGIDFSKFAHTRVVPFSDMTKELEVELNCSVVQGAKALDTILGTADKLLADDPDKSTVLSLVKDLMETDQPTDVVKNFLEEKVEA